MVVLLVVLQPSLAFLRSSLPFFDLQLVRSLVEPGMLRSRLLVIRQAKYVEGSVFPVRLGLLIFFRPEFELLFRITRQAALFPKGR